MQEKKIFLVKVDEFFTPKTLEVARINEEKVICELTKEEIEWFSDGLVLLMNRTDDNTKYDRIANLLKKLERI